MPDATYDPEFVNPRKRYRHKPIVQNIAAARESVQRGSGGITKWLGERQIALTASTAKMLEEKFERTRIAEQKADEAAAIRSKPSAVQQLTIAPMPLSNSSVML